MVLRETYGSYNTYLEGKYFERVSNQLMIGDFERKDIWATYNQVILELKNNIQDSLRVKELQYMLTDKENPQEACISVLEGVKLKSPELERLYYKIKNF